MLITQRYTPRRELFVIIANLLGTFFRKMGELARGCCARKRVESSNVNDHCHVNTFKLTGVGSQPLMVL